MANMRSQLNKKEKKTFSPMDLNHGPLQSKTITFQVNLLCYSIFTKWTKVVPL